ncbi:branched-chain amino acid ABC transporter ATPase [Actinoplanes sp. SE50]|uniref:ABC transporter ATP-binding protein n=1 Tax=unclassified Actinoplanes TaxID=2626549 RepID=UPI00023EC5E2|nr:MULTISPECIES: ABC transporter ATP-binding protein [unclassified Actinoplanes]AEV83644.1 branched-chain amino acid transport system ATP-binding protein [Actinoplanes sp. SE50/110]ATO82212.1 branched-chain amino acid ABC transporter ATPase [Actinoplanes sp. SE50]SLL99619.1 ABC transporter ATP-binding protein [Actinoplanes sp. SE50/110]
MSTPILRVADLSVRLGGSHILQGVTFDVAPTGVTALLGRNGVGKTTTLRAILGEVPAEGAVAVDGKPILGRATHRLVRDGLGYIPEDRCVFAGLTVAENLRLAERTPEPDYPLVHDLFPELEQRAAQRAGTLSGGQQQMVAIARVLLNPNRLLLVDEPTKGLAPAVVTAVATVLARVAERVPVLLVEQNLAVVRRLAGDAVVLEAGRVAWRGPATDLLGDAAATKSLLGVGTTAGSR